MSTTKSPSVPPPAPSNPTTNQEDPEEIILDFMGQTLAARKAAREAQAAQMKEHKLEEMLISNILSATGDPKAPRYEIRPEMYSPSTPKKTDESSDDTSSMEAGMSKLTSAEELAQQQLQWEDRIDFHASKALKELAQQQLQVQEDPDEIRLDFATRTLDRLIAKKQAQSQK